MTPEALFLVGPTASGKSEIAFELAQRVQGEIISADSMQVYRGVPLLTQQPSLRCQERVPHHCIAVRDPAEAWSAAAFRAAALPLIDEIRRRGRVPLIIGGTGLYVRALLDGLCEAPSAQPLVRERLLGETRTLGAGAVHARLAAVDPVAAGRIHPHDVRRIIRALEVYEVTGEPLSRRWERQSPGAFPYRFMMLGLDRPRPELHARINARVERMFAEGVVDEVRALAAAPLSHVARQMLGLLVILEHLAGRLSREDTVALVQQHTRQYARRQLIWFRRDARVRWVPCGQRTPADIAQHLSRQLVSLAAIH